MLKEGDKAPDFRLPGRRRPRDRPLRPARQARGALFLSQRPITPGCTNEGGEFRDVKPQFDNAGAVILGCSADSVETQAKFKDKYKLNFPLLSDPEFKAIEAYGARRMKSFLGKSFLGIVRITFLIGPDGRIAKIWDKVRVKGHAAEVLEAAKQLAASKKQKSASASE